MASELTPLGASLSGAFALSSSLFFLQPLCVTLDYLNVWRRFPPLKALPNGLIFNVFSSIPSSSLSFGSNQFIHEVMKPKGEIEKCIESIFAGVLGSPFTTVVERIGTMQRLHARQAREVVKELMCKRGIKGLLDGAAPTMWREGIFYFSYWIGMDRVNRILPERWFEEGSTLKKTTSAAISGALAGILSAPFNRMRTEWQEKAHGAEGRRIFVELQRYYKKGGMREVFYGGIPRSFFIASVITLMDTFEKKAIHHMPPSLKNSDP